MARGRERVKNGCLLCAGAQEGNRKKKRARFFFLWEVSVCVGGWWGMGAFVCICVLLFNMEDEMKAKAETVSEHATYQRFAIVDAHGPHGGTEERC